jgi:hypothetical protein
VFQFHEATKQLSPNGSPYLNFVKEVYLGLLSEQQMDEILQQSKRHFTNDERHFITKISGGHSYLVEKAISALSQPSSEKEPIKVAERHFYSDFNLKNILQCWPSNIRKAFIFVAQKKELSNLLDELDDLEKQGFIIKNEVEWQINPQILVNCIDKKIEQQFTN